MVVQGGVGGVFAMTTTPGGTIGAIQTLASQLTGIGGQLSAAASSGDFGAVLAQVNSEIASIQDGGILTSGSSSNSAAPTSNLLTSQSPLGLSTLGSLAATTVGGSSSTPGALTGSSVVADAQSYLGVPYQWGGSSQASGFDCSGLVQRVYADLGVSLPRTSQQQALSGTPVASLAQAQPGDLVFFAGSDGTASSPGHVGIYIGNGQMIDAPQAGSVVSVQPVGQPVAIRRIVGGPSTTMPVLNLTSAAGSTSSTGTNAAMDSLGVPAVYQPLFQSAGQAYGVDPVLLAAVAKQESGFNPAAQSSAGALGIMQLMPATAAGLGVSPLDPASAISGGAQLLSSYLGNYGGSVPLALAAYNAGPGAVAAYGGVPPYAQTQNYVSSISSMLANVGAVA